MSTSSINDDDRLGLGESLEGSKNYRQGRFMDGELVTVLTQLHAVQEGIAHLRHNHQRIQEDMRSQLELLNDRVGRLNDHCTVLEEHLNCKMN
jgi:hypothetical protein